MAQILYCGNCGWSVPIDGDVPDQLIEHGCATCGGRHWKTDGEGKKYGWSVKDKAFLKGLYIQVDEPETSSK